MIGTIVLKFPIPSLMLRCVDQISFERGSLKFVGFRGVVAQFLLWGVRQNLGGVGKSMSGDHPG